MDPYGRPLPYPSGPPQKQSKVPLILGIVGGSFLALIVVAGIIGAIVGKPHKAAAVAGASPSASATPSHSATHRPKATHHSKPSKPSWPPTAVRVTAAEFGVGWPFRDGVTFGLVGCDLQHPGAILFTAGDGPPGIQGTPIAINGTALDAGYPDIPKSMWKPDPTTGAYIDISPLQDKAPNDCVPPS